MDVLVSVPAYGLYGCFLWVIGRARLAREIKLTLYGVSLISVLVLQMLNAFLLFTTAGMVCFMSLWLSSIGLLAPAHTTLYTLRVKKVQLIKTLLVLISTAPCDESKVPHEQERK